MRYYVKYSVGRCADAFTRMIDVGANSIRSGFATGDIIASLGAQYIEPFFRGRWIGRGKFPPRLEVKRMVLVKSMVVNVGLEDYYGRSTSSSSGFWLDMYWKVGYD